MTLIGLESLKPPRGARRKKKLLGRGPGSGHGKTSTRGIKGQTSRAGRDFYPGFEGGQTPLIRRIPKRGFSNVSFQDRYQIVNIKDLAKIKEPVIDPQLLEQAGLIKNKDKLTKILGEGELSQPLTVKAHAFSKKAKELVEKAGGKIEIIHA
ncbi:MAG: 50S ribosomal protein L15 [Candidatus Omnitrophota bacterium]|nr:50S ribosomal protein L15 [Candidatus Omnitrophota bacterium]